MTVRERILRGELAIGQVISRRKVAAELGMSFLPVSEALLRLEHEGLLESRPRSGTRVRVPPVRTCRGTTWSARPSSRRRLCFLLSTPQAMSERNC